MQGVRITRQVAEYRAIQLESLIMKIIKPEKKIQINDLIDRILSHPRFDWATVNNLTILILSSQSLIYLINFFYKYIYIYIL